MPLFAMALFVEELDIFHGLSESIGPESEPGSLPFLPPSNPDGPFTHRNISGVCDNPDLLERYNRIAATIKARSNMQGVLVNMQLAPHGVVCVLHPVINTEDFPEGIMMNNTGVLGHDLLNDPARKFIAEATIPQDDIVIAGPLTLKQCKDCAPIVRRAFIVRLAIAMKGQNIVVGGEAYEKWGFAVVLLNWDALLERSGVYEKFKEHGYEFQLTRTDVIVDQVTGATSEKVRKASSLV